MKSPLWPVLSINSRLVEKSYFKTWKDLYGLRQLGGDWWEMKFHPGEAHSLVFLDAAGIAFEVADVSERGNLFRFIGGLPVITRFRLVEKERPTIGWLKTILSNVAHTQSPHHKNWAKHLLWKLHKADETAPLDETEVSRLSADFYCG